ncbi:uncharacterized protein LOC121736505 [Aricia agestis]|uniref:uncharacterized protein LOC121736505 n=1 Tax=Aricia agestis TaxID=91739 RepID=UPI001C205360|nr:uncharacterized protein LOC121736505 [Aricia agestis]
MLLLMIVCLILLQTSTAVGAYNYREINNRIPWKPVYRTGKESEDNVEKLTTKFAEHELILRTNTELEDTTVNNENETIFNTTLDEEADLTSTAIPTTEIIIPNDTITMDTMNSAALDVPALMNLIMNLTSDIESNLTMRLNETLQRMSLPTCGTPTTVPTTTSEYDANYTGSIVAKCFVCGLEVRGVPAHAHCGDAFAGDFLPLVPVDPTAKSKISRFRKYCKYQNIPGFAYNSSDTRSIFGRWTGGCAVRWVDLSGIYTQRTCRSRLAPSVGQHYGSKRMAKLERALWMVDNGCIVSPMATLVPLSRGVSLYARFHACVCTGSWCNVAPNVGPQLFNVVSVLIVMFHC